MARRHIHASALQRYGAPNGQGRVPAGCAVGTPTSLEKPGDGPSVQSGKGGQLDDIHPPLARLALGDERLPLAETPRHLHLGQPRLTARLAQASQEAAARPADLVQRTFTATRPNQLWVADLT